MDLKRKNSFSKVCWFCYQQSPKKKWVTSPDPERVERAPPGFPESLAIVGPGGCPLIAYLLLVANQQALLANTSFLPLSRSA